MDIQQVYNAWSEGYDSVLNKTRDLEAKAFRQTLSGEQFSMVLELACGTGKNTEWLVTKAAKLVCADFSEQMLAKAKEKIHAPTVSFHVADICQEWTFTAEKFDLITISLALEHIQNLDVVFAQISQHLVPGGLFYMGELHPFKQYLGSKARFDTGDGIFELECFVHHLSDYFSAAQKNGLECIRLGEWFDEDDALAPPRLLSVLFTKG
jgi:ubiquinone/menaquinone biosynthesis C-methylase UbiE